MSENQIIPPRQKPPQKINKIREITLKNYDEMAMKFAKASGETEFPTMAKDSPECVAWGKYFDNHLGGRPGAYKALISERIKLMTIPTQWPEWFDPSYGAAE